MKAWIRIPLQLLTVGAFGVLVVVTVITGAYYYAEPSLPSAAELRDVRFQIPMRVYSRDGKLMQQYGEQKRTPAEIDEIPERLVNAVVAAEDDRFWEHPGIDILSTIRAGVMYMLNPGERVPGASTITQQISRTTNLLSRDYALGRKIKEIFLAYRIEEEFEKEDIIELYLNTYEFGHRSFGVVSTARTYFNKELDELTLSEIAIIAGIPQGPSIMNPYTSPERAATRRAYVLRRMDELGYITPAERQAALEEPILSALFDVDIELSAPYVADMVYEWCQRRFGKQTCDTEGLEVTTTVDSRLQSAADIALKSALEAYDRKYGYRGPIARVDIESLLADSSNPESSTDSLADALNAFLADYPVQFDAEAAIVVDANEIFADVYLRSVGLISLGLDSVAWARSFNENNRPGPSPMTVNEVLTAGDVVRFRRRDDGGFELFQVPDVEGAFVSLDPMDGAIVALVGGYSYSKSSFNRAAQGQRQPGSSFKPFFYLSALDAGYTLSSIINDAPRRYYDETLEEYHTVRNYGGENYGDVSLRFALTRSLNTVADRIAVDILPRNSVRYLRRFGFGPDALPNNASLALGSGGVTPVELAGAYSILANGGYAVGIPSPEDGRVAPYFVGRVEDADGNLLYDSNLSVELACRETNAVEEAPARTPSDPLIKHRSELFPKLRCADQVESPQRIYLITDVLKDIVRSNSRSRAAFPRRTDLAGKTGTTTGPRDAWFAGFNADVVAVVRVGFDIDTRELGSGEQGGVTAIPAWIDFMEVALEDMPNHSLPRPPGITELRINPGTGLIAADCNRDARFEMFLVENVPDQESDARCTATGPDETGQDRLPANNSIFQ